MPAAIVMDENQKYPSSDRQQLLALDASGEVASVEVGKHAYAWRVPGVIAGVLMALFLYVLARLLFRRRTVAVFLGLIVLVDGMLFAQSRIGMNDSYVGLGIVGAYTIFAALWLRPGETRRHWLAFALGVPLIGRLPRLRARREVGGRLRDRRAGHPRRSPGARSGGDPDRRAHRRHHGARLRRDLRAGGRERGQLRVPR